MSPLRIDGPLEVRLLADGARGQAHAVRLPAAVQRGFVALAAAFVLLLLAGLATAPSTISSLWLSREYDVQVGRRQQLGERLQALVDELAELRRQGAVMARRLAKIEAIYELPDAGAARPPVGGDAGRPAESIFASTIAHGHGLQGALARDLELARQRLETVAAFERGHADLVAAVPVRSPLAGAAWVRTSGFGPRRSPFTRELELHAGLDLAAPIGTPVLAPAAGVVTFAGPVEADRRSDWWRMGRMVVVRHGDHFLTLYGHCEELAVRDGQRVAAGDRLATVGETGWTTAPHLHYEIRRHRPTGEWQAVDPLDYALGLLGEEDLAAVRPRPAPDTALGSPPPLLPAFLR